MNVYNGEHMDSMYDIDTTINILAMPFYSKFYKILKYVVPVGKCKLQTICVFLLWGIQPR